MNSSTPPHTFTILITTGGNADYVERLVESLRDDLLNSRIPTDLLIVDNQSVLEPSEPLQRIAASLAGVGCYLKYPIGGKSCALNHAIGKARGDVLLFLDDDMRAVKGWLAAAQAFFEESDYDLMQGRILPDPSDDLTPCEYPMVPTCDKGLERRDFRGLGGGNVGGRAEWYRRFPFDERLGVGATGAGEDSKFAHEAQRAGARVGYEPKALVYHPLIASRANQQTFRRAHYISGKSSCTYRRFRLFPILCNLLYHALAYPLFRILRISLRRTHRQEAALFRNLGRLAGLLEQHLEGSNPNS
jgi:glycosyltransferase involved in cell wall biosynthesis